MENVKPNGAVKWTPIALRAIAVYVVAASVIIMPLAIIRTEGALVFPLIVLCAGNAAALGLVVVVLLDLAEQRVKS